MNLNTLRQVSRNQKADQPMYDLKKKSSSRRKTHVTCFFTHNRITAPKTTREGQESTTKTRLHFVWSPLLKNRALFAPSLRAQNKFLFLDYFYAVAGRNLEAGPASRSLIWQRMRAVSTATFRKKMAMEDDPTNGSREKKDRRRTPSLVDILSCSTKKNYPRGFGSQYLLYKIWSLDANGQLECLLTSRSSKRGGRSPTNSMTN